MKIPSLLLKQLYTFGSLSSEPEGVRFALTNRLSDATVTAISEIAFDGRPVPLDQLELEMGDGTHRGADQVAEAPIEFPLRRQMHVLWRGGVLDVGKHSITIGFEVPPFGKLSFEVEDAVREEHEERRVVPCDKENNYGADIIRRRQEFIEEHTGVHLEHLEGLLVRSRHDARQHRELHRRRPDPDRLRRAHPDQRRARGGRVPGARWPPPRAPWSPPTTAASRS